MHMFHHACACSHKHTHTHTHTHTQVAVEEILIGSHETRAAAAASAGVREPADHMAEDDEEEEDEDDDFGRLLGHLREFSELAALATGEMAQGTTGRSSVCMCSCVRV